MIKTKFTFFLLSIMLIFNSCSKEDEFKTDGELVGEHIQNLVNSENIKLATTYLVEYVGDNIVTWSDEYQTSFSIEGQIIKVGTTYYNLNMLVKYQVDTDNGNKILLLYFDGFQH